MSMFLVFHEGIRWLGKPFFPPMMADDDIKVLAKDRKWVRSRSADADWSHASQIAGYIKPLVPR